MTNFETLDTQLLSHHTGIKPATNSKSILITTSCLILGLALLSSASFIEDHTSGLYLAAICFPFLLLLVALFFLIFRRKQLVYASTGSPIISGHLYFDKSQMDVVISMLNADSPENIEWTGFKAHGNARLVYMVSRDAKFAAIQLDEYIPHNYEPVTDIFYYSDHHVHPIAQLLLLNPNR